MGETVDINQGEIKVNFESPTAGKRTFEELGIKDTDLSLENGLLRLVFDLEGIGEHSYYQMPTIEIAYKEEMAETHWICEFNGETILDKMDHHGHSTVLLLNRKVLEGLEQHHQNVLIIHAEFPKAANLIGADSYVNFFK